MGSRGKGGQRRKPQARARPVNPPRPGTSGRAGSSAKTARQRRAAADRARARKRWTLLALGLVASVALLGLGLVLNADERGQAKKVLAALTAGDCTFDERTDGGRDHVSDPDYSVNPPAGGDHTPTPAPAGRYDADDIPRDGDLVHSLEHGFVVLWHRPDIGDDALDALMAVHDANPGSTLVVPRESLDVPVAATAWHRRLLCDGGVEAEPLSIFVATYKNKGPEKGRPPAFPS